LALKEQVLDSDKVPMGEHDWKMDKIVTADGVIDAAD
jgi:5-formyltetrahydrofolate cyclo-ligase